MTAARVVELCRRLEHLGLTIWLDGGWGVDALLGQQTRPHDDLDIVVEEKDLHRLRSLLEADGFAVECLTVEHQLARSDYTLRDKDFADLRALRERFGLRQP